MKLFKDRVARDLKGAYKRFQIQMFVLDNQHREPFSISRTSLVTVVLFLISLVRNSSHLGEMSFKL